MAFIRLVALDLDGTLATGDRVSAAALAAIDRARQGEVMVALVTGRILGELEDAFPGLLEHFDAVVAENGGVLVIGGDVRDLAVPVDDALAETLAARGIRMRRGRVLLAGAGRRRAAVAAAVEELGLDCQLLRNRGELMVLPASVSKGTGLRAAASALGISVHNTIAVGDAENDLALLESAELGVAVANCVPSVRAHADLVLDQADGGAIAELLSGPLLSGEAPYSPPRRRLTIGRFVDGDPAAIPGAQANVLICGDTGTGKSHLAGLLAERWIAAGYTVLVLDMEGDYTGLDGLHGTLVLDHDARPEPGELAGLLGEPSRSLILDLSRSPDKLDYLRRLQPAIALERPALGMPHWILIDEAQSTLAHGGVIAEAFRPHDRGYCLVTYQPEQLSSVALATIDITITLHERFPTGPRRDSASPATASLREAGAPERRFSLDPRRTAHVRHWHKYAAAELPRNRWFEFRSADGAPVAAAGTLDEFVEQLLAAESAVIAHHVRRGDFSRWITATLQDRGLAAAVAAVERDVLSRQAATLRQARQRIADQVQQRYLSPRITDEDVRRVHRLGD